MCVCVCIPVLYRKIYSLCNTENTSDNNCVRQLSPTRESHTNAHKVWQNRRLITCSAATNWIVLTSTRDCPGEKLNLIVSRKCALSIWISTNTYSILIPAVESMGTAARQRQKKDRWILQSCFFRLLYMEHQNINIYTQQYSYTNKPYVSILQI